MCTSRRQAGVTLVELILYIAIVSVGIAGILSVMNITTLHSADPMVRKQAIAAAESLLEEILLKDFSNPSGGYSGADRSQFDDVDDYSGYASTGISTIDGSPIAALADYDVSVSVVPEALGAVAAGQAKRITVTVSGPGTPTSPGGESIQISGYRTNYAP